MSFHVHTLASHISDNYFWMLHCARARQLLLIDPIDAELAIAAVKGHGGRLVGVVNTHWHRDHVGGNKRVLQAFPDAPLMAPAAETERIAELGQAQVTRALEAGDAVQLGDASLRVLHTPGHTHGHLSLHHGERLFSGDVIFSGGAGHCRSGDPGALSDTFARVLRALDPDTTFYPGHDYALTNLDFALSILPDDPEIIAQRERVQGRERPEILLTTLGEEARFNLFMRVDDPAVQQAVRDHDAQNWARAQAAASQDSPAHVTFRALRALRDAW